MDIFSKISNWGYSEGIKGIEKQIHKIIEKRRLIFLDKDYIRYIEKNGHQSNYTFDQMASKFILVGKWADDMANLGLTIDDVKGVLVREYDKQKEVKDGKGS
jgi:hypothetical protein